MKIAVVLIKKYGHERDLKRGDINNGFVKHNLETNHNFNFKNHKMLVYMYKKKRRKFLNPVSFQTTAGFFQFIAIFGEIGA